MHLKGKMPNLKTDVDCFNIDKSLGGKDCIVLSAKQTGDQEYKQAIRSHLTVIQGVCIVTVASVLLVAVEAVIVRSAEHKYYQIFLYFKYFHNYYLSSKSAALAGKPEVNNKILTSD